MAPRFELVEFFVGAGLVRAGLGPHWSCRLAVDDDPAKRSAYGLNFPLAEFVCADVAKLTLTDLPAERVGMLWKSPPCISLSAAGTRDGMVPSVRGSGAIWAALRLTAALAKGGRAPRLVVIENVVEILKDKDWPVVVGALAGCGYRVGAAVIDARRFVPQSRERAFVIAAAADVEIPLDLVADCPTAWHAPAPVGAAHAVLPAELRRSWAWWRLPEPPQRTSVLSDVIEDRPTGVAWDSEIETRRLIAMMTPLHKEKVEAAKRAGRRMVGGLFKRIRKENGKKVQRAEVRFDDVAGALRVPTGGSSKQTVMIVDGDTVCSRLLSPRECARLMGLSDAFRLPSNTNEALGAIGDGVAAPVTRFLAENLLEPLLAAAQPSTAPAPVLGREPVETPAVLAEEANDLRSAEETQSGDPRRMGGSAPASAHVGQEDEAGSKRSSRKALNAYYRAYRKRRAR